MTAMQSALDRLIEMDLAPLSRPALPTGVYSLYAIAFDLDTSALEANYHNTSWKNGYGEIRRILEEEGFTWTQGSVHMGDPDKVNAVSCVLTAQRLARELPWFSASVRDMKMFRIEENNDLMPAIQAV
jgi:virulence-associated protein VapD